MLAQLRPGPGNGVLARSAPASAEAFNELISATFPEGGGRIGGMMSSLWKGLGNIFGHETLVGEGGAAQEIPPALPSAGGDGLFTCLLPGVGTTCPGTDLWRRGHGQTLLLGSPVQGCSPAYWPQPRPCNGIQTTEPCTVSIPRNNCSRNSLQSRATVLAPGTGPGEASRCAFPAAWLLRAPGAGAGAIVQGRRAQTAWL